MDRAVPIAPVVAEHGALVLRICVAILGDRHLGADAAQETWLRFLRLPDRAAIANAGAWLRRAAVSCAIDLARRRPQAGEPSEDPLDPAAPDPARLAEVAEVKATLDRAVARLPEAQRTVFRLRHDAGLPLAEVAETLGIALTTAKTHFARACVRVQAALRPHLRPESGP